MRNRYRQSFFLALIWICFSATTEAHIDEADLNGDMEGDTALSSENPHIPEPMVFDLIRPLGVKQGEVEINTLVMRDPAQAHTEWAPEFEIGIRDNLAIEFELPLQNSRIESYKLALQGTMGRFFDRRAIHGWQVIGYYDREHGSYKMDSLYLLGLRLADQFSTLNMLGLRRDDFNPAGTFSGLFNSAWFYDYSQKVTLGLEFNSEFKSHGKWNYLVMPQIHLDFASHTSLQLGVGLSQYEARKTGLQTGLRLIYAF